MDKEQSQNETVKEDATDTKDTVKDKETKQENLLTQEEVNEIISNRLARERKKFEEELKEKEELAKLSAEEKEKRLREKREEELRKKEQELQFKELELTTRVQVQEKGLPVEFTDYIIRSTEEETTQALDQFTQVWDSKIEEEVKKRVEEKLKGRDQTISENLPKDNIASPNSIDAIAQELNIRNK